MMKIDDVDIDYAKRAAQWQRCRDAFEGSDAIKARRTLYLPQSEAHDGREYGNYLARALFLPVTSRTTTMMLGLAFRKELTIKTPARMASDITTHLKDVTLSGDDIGQIASDTLRELINVGRFAIVLAYSGVLNRPFWKTYPTEDILRREFIRLPSGITTLGRCVLREWRADPEMRDGSPREYLFDHYLQTDPDEPTRLQYAIQAWREKVDPTRRRGKKDDERFEKVGEPFVPLRMGTPLDRLPIKIATSNGNDRTVPKPMVLDIVDVNIAHYRNSADREHGAYWTARPTPWVTGHTVQRGTTLRVGGEKAWVIPSENAKVGMLEYTGKGLGELQSLMTEKEQYMAKLGASMLETRTRQAESAEALRLRSAESGASLADAVFYASKALTVALWLHVWWLYGDAEPLDDDIDVSINREFVEVKMDPQMLTALVSAVQAGEISYATFYYNLERGSLTRPGISAEEEQDAARADMEDRPDPEPQEDDDTIEDEPNV